MRRSPEDEVLGTLYLLRRHGYRGRVFEPARRPAVIIGPLLALAIYRHSPLRAGGACLVVIVDAKRVPQKIAL